MSGGIFKQRIQENQSGHASGGSSLTNHHVMPIYGYFAVFFALLILTALTVGVSYLGLPAPYSILVAMIVAIIKASLVAVFFMHLNFDEPFNRLVFLGSLLFLGLFFFFTFADITTRGDVNSEERQPFAAPSLRTGTSPSLDSEAAHGENESSNK